MAEDVVGVLSSTYSWEEGVNSGAGVVTAGSGNSMYTLIIIHLTFHCSCMGAVSLLFFGHDMEMILLSL